MVALGCVDSGRSLVGGLHQAGTAAGDDVAAHLGQGRRHALDLVVDIRPWFGPCRAENGHAVAVTLRGSQASQVVDDVHRPNTVLVRICLTDSSSARLTVPCVPFPASLLMTGLAPYYLGKQ